MTQCICVYHHHEIQIGDPDEPIRNLNPRISPIRKKVGVQFVHFVYPASNNHVKAEWLDLQGKSCV